MFTGLVTAIGTIDRVADSDAGREFRIQCDYEGTAAGESIAVNGACLTVREHGLRWFTVAAVVTTLDRTAIGSWDEGRLVNLERALELGDRLGGHVVQGHVDGCAIVDRVERRRDALLVDLAMPTDLLPLMVPHGAVTVDGVSLTVNALQDPQIVQVSLIDFTRRHTTLGALIAGDRVHVEADVIGKYVQRLVAPYLAAAAE